ncbi:DUF5694 domain-containing protein [Saprospiraceae bacterium]|nr:DUF5694 domain-containing protein [Saprospiraceae bacterium]
MKNLFIFLFTVSIIFSCNNEKTVVNDIPISKKNELNKLEQTEVLTLGCFHFDFPNLDVNKTNAEDQIDVLDAKYQEEIKLIVDKLAKFSPTKIVIERGPERQKVYDSLYTSYLNGTHNLSRSEEQQIGFRLAKQMGLEKVYCTDSWSNDYEDVLRITDGKDTIAKEKFMDYLFNNPDSLLTTYRDEINLYKTEGILSELKRKNSKEFVKKGLGDYLIGIFKYETEDYNQFGPDFVTSWWFNRNLRIFRNIQRINATTEDRILVIYGSGHMNLLNIFFEASPEYELLSVNDFLD